MPPRPTSDPHPHASGDDPLARWGRRFRALVADLPLDFGPRDEQRTVRRAVDSLGAEASRLAARR